MDLAILAGKNRKEVADPFNWVIRAKIQSAMDEQYHRCKVVIDQHLKAYYGERQGSVFARAGITGRATVELFEGQASRLVGALAESVRPLSLNPRAFQMIAETTMGFVTYLDLVVGRIGPRIDLETRNYPKSENLAPATGDMWRESRQRIVEALGRHREDFGLTEGEPLAEPPGMRETEEDARARAPEDELPVPRFDLLAPAEPMPEPPMAEDREDHFPPILDLELEFDEPGMEPVSEPLPSMNQWHEMWAEIAVQLCKGQLVPRTREDVRLAMTDWLAVCGMNGFENEVDECARAFWKKFAPAQPVRSSLGLGGIGSDAAMFDRLAWQSDSPRSAGLTTSANVLPRKPDVRCSVAPAPPEMPCTPAIEAEPALDEPDSMSIRYHVSWSERPAPIVPAPFIDIGWE